MVLFAVLLSSALIFVGTQGYKSFATEETRVNLASLTSNRKETVEKWFQSVAADIETLAVTPSTTQAMQWLETSWNALDGDPGQVLQAGYINDNPNEAGSKHLLDRAEGSDSYHDWHADVHPYYRNLIENKGYYDLFLVNIKGDVIYSVFKESDFATNLMSGPYSDSGLADAFKTVLELDQGDVRFTDFQPYAPSGLAPAAFMSTPIFTTRGKRIGVLVIQLPSNQLVSALNKASGLGQTGEAFLVGPDGTTRSASRFDGRFSILDPIETGFQERPSTEQPFLFSENTRGIEGMEVMSALSNIRVFDQDWSLVVQKDRQEIFDPINQTRNKLIALSAVCAVILSGFGWLFTNSITRPIDRLGNTMKAMEAGNYAVEVSDVGRSDEIGKMANTLESFRGRLAQSQSLEDQQVRLQKDQTAVVSALSAALIHLSEGNLTKTIDEAFPHEHEGLRADFNKTVHTLRDLIGEVVDASNSIRHGSFEIGKASEDLSHRTENQAATLEQTAAALDEMTASVKSAADGAKSVKQIVADARDEAEKSGEIVQRAVAAMTEIEESSDHISKIIGVIDDIAFQTNLLALNAGVEAARAGDAGKGFAVVASEVRALAQRSSDAAQEIKTLIGGSTQQVENGAQLVSKAGDALTLIVERVANISKLVADIANGSNEQAIGLNEINIGVTQLDQVTQENAAMVERSSTASVELTSDAERLSHLVLQFDLGEGAQSAEIKTLPVAAVHGEDWADDKSFAPTSIVVDAPASQKGVWQDF